MDTWLQEVRLMCLHDALAVLLMLLVALLSCRRPDGFVCQLSRLLLTQ
jgi:hypothetical protein